MINVFTDWKMSSLLFLCVCGVRVDFKEQLSRFYGVSVAQLRQNHYCTMNIYPNIDAFEKTFEYFLDI